MCIFHTRLSQSLWSEYQWKDLFLPQNLGVNDPSFGPRWLCQKKNIVKRSSRPVTAGTGVNRLILINWAKLNKHSSCTLLIYLVCLLFSVFISSFIYLFTKKSSRHNVLKTCFGMTHAIISLMYCCVFHNTLNWWSHESCRNMSLKSCIISLKFC